MKLTLALLITLLVSTVSAQELRKKKFNHGPWENKIGYAQAVRVGNTLYICPLGQEPPTAVDCSSITMPLPPPGPGDPTLGMCGWNDIEKTYSCTSNFFSDPQGVFKRDCGL